MPTTISKFQFAIFNYAKGDAESKIWIFPGKGLMSHNIKALSIFLRYVLGLLLLIFSFSNPPLVWLLIFGVFAYLTWAYRKVYLEYRDVRTALWGPVLQITSDFGLMSGFMSGIFKRP